MLYRAGETLCLTGQRTLAPEDPSSGRTHVPFVAKVRFPLFTPQLVDIGNKHCFSCGAAATCVAREDAGATYAHISS